MISHDAHMGAEKDLNVFQIIAINVLSSVSIFTCAMILGAPFLAAFFGAWLAGGAATLAIAVAISHLRQRHLSRPEQVVIGPALVPANISDPFQLWEADRLMEMDHASTVTRGTGQIEVWQEGPEASGSDSKGTRPATGERSTLENNADDNRRVS